MARKPRLLILCLVALVSALVAVPALAASGTSPVTGAIFTTTGDGTTVNGNIYESKDDVYLNGGPQPNAPCTAAGLQNGNYYFQVTDPSGSVLLSTDTIDHRMVTVANGVITAVNDHATSTGKCGSLSAQLKPFDNTPNAGGEYKVWMTPVGSYVANYADGDGTTFGFVNSQSKTDNFKVRTSSNGTDQDVGIVGNKFYDANVNGVWDKASEPGIGGWKIYKKPPEIPDETDTTSVGQIGQYSFLVAPNSGAYTITEGMPQAGFFPYSAWKPTTATSGGVDVQGTDVAGPDFGNVCLGSGGGLTLGFWSNQNGQNLIVTRDAKGKPTTTLLLPVHTLLSVAGNGNPYLRNANGTFLTLPSSGDYTTLKNWLLKADATNMAYMLSAQLAAMKLNVYNGFVSGNALIYAPGTPDANSYGYATVNAVMADATTALQSNGYTVKAGQTRTDQEALKIALDRANNNLNFVQPVTSDMRAPCAVPQSWAPAS